MGKDDINRIDIAEFRCQGYLQEVNRRFFHPLGLALEVAVAEDGVTESLGGVWDYRNDPEGIAYGDGMIDADKARWVQSAWDEREPARRERLGYMVQPAEGGA